MAKPKKYNKKYYAEVLRKRCKPVFFWLTKDESAALKRIAKSRGLSKIGLVRSWIKRASQGE